MSRPALGLVLLATLAGTAADRVPSRRPLVLGGYHVLAADFHLHSSTWSDGALTAFGLVLEAEHQGMDVIAITGHNQVSDGQAGRWFSNHFGGPIVIVGQEILSPGHHVIAVGTDQVVDSRLRVAAQVAEVHAQGGVAIAAHPLPQFWPAFNADAIDALDGAEICHPLIYGNEATQRDFEQFAARASKPPAAIGSSDFHGFGRIGMCRTYVFAREVTADAVLDAIRARRTVVYGFGGKAYGDPALIELAATHAELRDAATGDPAPTWLDWISRTLGVIGLIGIALRWPGTSSLWKLGAGAGAARRFS